MTRPSAVDGSAAAVAVRGVVLDLDGTLVDSNDAHAHAWLDAFREFGYEPPFEDVRRLIGMGGDQLMPRAIGLGADSGAGKEIADRRGAIFRERYLPHLRPFPGARALIERIRADGIMVVAGTSAKSDEADALLRIAGITDLVQGATTADDAEESKPEPDIVAAALKQLALPATAAIMLGDTPYDVTAAARAGVRAVALRCGGWDRPDLDGAVAVYDDPAGLLAHYDDSPFAASRGR